MERLEASPHAGLVTAVENGIATVRFRRSSMCSHCGACLAIGEKELETHVRNELNATVGDRVEVSMAGKRVLEASVLAYVVPLVFLLLGVWLGSMISDLWAVVFGVLGCAVAFLLLKRMDRTRGLKVKFSPRMTAILTDGPSEKADA